MDKVVVTRGIVGLCHMQVCAHKDATDEEILEQSIEEAAGDVEAQERLKSATQKADMERIKELTGYESNEKPEAK